MTEVEILNSQLSSCRLFIVILITALGVMVILTLSDWSMKDGIRKSIIKKGWFFRKHKYKIIESEEDGRYPSKRYNIYQQSKIGVWFFLDYYGTREQATSFIRNRYNKYSSVTKKHTEYIDPTKLIESDTEDEKENSIT